MTKLILNPGDLSLIFPDISISNPQRIRILCQVIKYIPNESCLIIDKIPTVAESSTNKESLVKIDIFDILEDILSIEIINKGTIINIDGYYDGEKFNLLIFMKLMGLISRLKILKY